MVVWAQNEPEPPQIYGLILNDTNFRLFILFFVKTNG